MSKGLIASFLTLAVGAGMAQAQSEPPLASPGTVPVPAVMPAQVVMPPLSADGVAMPNNMPNPLPGGPGGFANNYHSGFANPPAGAMMTGGMPGYPTYPPQGMPLNYAMPEAFPPGYGQGHYKAPHEVDEPETGPWYYDFEFLLWFMQSAPAGAPTLTAGTTDSQGRVGVPGTVILVGDERFSSNPMAGYRLSVGHWLDCEQNYGWEINGFVSQRIVDGEQVIAIGNPNILARPFQNAQNNSPASLLIAAPGLVDGVALVAHSSQFWGAEAMGMVKAFEREKTRMFFTGGFKYFGLDESLRASSGSFLQPGINVVLNNQLVQSPGVIVIDDWFRTNNQFFGGELGFLTEYRRGRWFVDASTKLAIGGTHQRMEISGFSGAFTPGTTATPIVAPGGLLATSTNIGTYTNDRFTFIPEIGLRMGYQVTNWMNVFVGYNLLYISSVIRPGDQTNLVVNPTRVPASQNFGNLVGPALPAPLFNQTDVTLQAISLGLSLGW